MHHCHLLSEPNVELQTTHGGTFFYQSRLTEILPPRTPMRAFIILSYERSYSVQGARYRALSILYARSIGNPEAMQLKYKEARKQSSWRGCLVEETEAHILVGLLLLLLLLLLNSLSSGVATSGTTSGTTGSGGTTTGTDVHEEVLDVLALESLGEDGGPDGLDISDLSGGDEGLELVGGDLNAIIGEDQGRVGLSELGVRHCE